MSKNKKKNLESNPTYEVVRKIRGDWGNVKPYTRIEKSKKYKKPKHKGRQYDD